MKKNCLITGGNGFLGKKYCNFFLKNKFKVFCVDINLKKIKKKKILFQFCVILLMKMKLKIYLIQ